ncbi:MAG TPA: hypothetical protein VHQ65_16985 [Thermoanaerobaculia bacterium]|nr:hypothetical protein [Thermoanaerobaculia bacterium]
MPAPPPSDNETRTTTGRGRPGAPTDNQPFLVVAAVCLAATLFAAFVSAPAAVPDRTTPVLATLAFDDAGQLAWNGLSAGMTRREAERVVGSPLEPVPVQVERCGETGAAARVAGRTAVLSFAGPGAEAPLRAVSVAGRAASGAAVEARFPSMEQVVAGPRPIYRTAADELLVVEPGAGIDFGEVCLD